MDDTEKTPEQIESDRVKKVTDSFIEKSKSYPQAWTKIYKKCKRSGEFSLLGKQLVD